MMIIKREIAVAGWSEDSAAAARDYLESRGFKNAQVHLGLETHVTGTRGSLLGNMTAFDMKRLRTRISLRPSTSSRVRVELNINTVGQQITEWNRAFWRLELIELTRVLHGRPLIADVWSRYRRERRGAFIRWLLSGGISGQRLPYAWQVEIVRLEEDLASSS